MIGIKEISAMTSLYKVLYVEDDETLAATVVQYFSKIFKEVVYANNGRKGLELYKENSDFDIVFTDVEMPIMSGLEMSEEIKKINPEQNIIIISSYSDADMFVASATLGIDGYIIKPINQFFSKNIIDSSTYELYIRSLMGDLARWQIQEVSVKQILRSISNKMTTTVSWQSITKETDIASHNTVSKYVGHLEDSFVLNTLYPVDITRKAADYKKEKKIYFQDPFIFHSLRSWVSGQTDYFNSTLSYLNIPENKSKLVESIVENHFIRFMYNVHPSDVFASHEHVFYWRKKGGKREVDFIIKSKNNELLPIELKFQNKIQKSDYKGLSKFNKGIFLSKNEFNVTGNYVTIPVSLFLLLV